MLIKTPSHPSSIAIVAAEAVPTPASTIIGTLAFSTISEILNLCRERNYFIRYKNGDNNRSLSLKLLPETIDALIETGFVTSNSKDKKSNLIQMSVDPVVAQKMEEFIANHP